MQLPLQLDDRAERLTAIDARLRRRFGAQGPWRLVEPMSQLVLAMVGGRTLEADSREAFVALADRFHFWEDLRDAPASEIEEIIRAVTFAEVKARRLKAALHAIARARGSLTIDFLADFGVEQALAWLERLPGVGRKTAASTLNFSTLRMKALVIDTHHLRVLRRLGLVGRRTVVAEAYRQIVPYLPASWSAADFDNHHQLMKRLGQEQCRHGQTNCTECALQDLCLFAA